MKDWLASFDVIVVGGGHAGCEAASASARMGAATVLITHKPETIGAMSCNPAIGGLGKGHMVREIDAMDGVMGRVADEAGIQFRLLNRRKGPAVRGPRAQSDRAIYKAAMQRELAAQQNLEILAGAVADIILDDKGEITGVALEDGRNYRARSVVLTTGTFLNGVIHMGPEQSSGGRIGEKPSVALAERLYALGLPMGRLKTGTPARLHKDSINWSETEIQPGDDPPVPFSYLTDKITTPQIPCHITRTTARTHEIIRENLHLSAMYSGTITGRGPRYCPSIEDKVVRFAEKEDHQIFLEPEGLTSDLIYPNGLSTSLPTHVQQAFLQSIPGLENVKIVQWAYAIEYDYVDPRSLTRALMLEKIPGFFLAGQINGTTGYEEAAGQGLVAGLNAARYAGGQSAFTIDRTDAYLGVMIDDLVSRGVSEPYRMFTSRAEFRLSLRADNADQRLTPLAIELGFVSERRKSVFSQKKQQLSHWIETLKELNLTPKEAQNHGLSINQDGQRRSGFDMLSYPSIELKDLEKVWPELAAIPEKLAEDIEIEATYSRYLDRQKLEVNLLKQEDFLAIPQDFDYDKVTGLSNEVRQKLKDKRPTTVRDAREIEGVTPASLTLLLRILRRDKRAA